MAIPSTALVWTEPMDPSDQVDYLIDCSSILADQEFILSYDISPYSEASLLGLSTSSNPSQVISGTKIRIWLSVDPAYQANSAFDATGTSLPILLTINTSSTPPRRRQRTLVVKVQQR